ncbi:metallophosphoesterase [Halopenitus sp. H-Gu1]|uniref:metallophosphoesterase n=1 Tax=Halopenitus sp. H-Gu1 TaxID=3242697 RepID=UPI00359DBBA5
MLTIVSDTHGTDDHRLTGRTLTAVQEADLVIHAGDFYREPVFEAFSAESETLRAVHGNNADAALRDRLPETRTVEYAGIRFAVVHTRRGGRTALALFGRERGADVVVFGHTHRPMVEDADPVTLLNPGSHTQPRGNRAAHAELEPIADADGDPETESRPAGERDGDRTSGLRGRLVTPDGDVFEQFRIDSSGTNRSE